MLPKMKKNSKHMKYIRREYKREFNERTKGIHPRSSGEENQLRIINGRKYSVAVKNVVKS